MADTETMKLEIFGKEYSLNYSEHSIGYSILVLRLVMGWTLFYAGIDKLLDPGWTAAGFLQNAIPAGNPFTGMWTAMAGVPAIDFLVMWGLTLTGFGLLVGALVRWNAFWGAVMMLFFWAASLPLEHGIVIDDHIVYAALLFGLGAFGAGRLFGIDHYLEDTAVVQQYPWLEYLLG